MGKPQTHKNAAPKIPRIVKNNPVAPSTTVGVSIPPFVPFPVKSSIVFLGAAEGVVIGPPFPNELPPVPIGVGVGVTVQLPDPTV